jgi:hypothetical protein
MPIMVHFGRPWDEKVFFRDKWVFMDFGILLPFVIFVAILVYFSHFGL